jgi:hypothetical protein
MESVTVFCPSCKTAYSEGRCKECEGSLDDHAPLFHMVCAAYNRSLALARNGKAEQAWSELATATPAFPFVERALDLLFELSLVVQEFNTAATAAAWLSPFRNAPQKEELRQRISDAIHDGPDKTSYGISEAASNAQPTAETSSIGSGRRHRIIYTLLVTGLLAIAISAVVFGLNSSRRAMTLDDEIHAATSQHNEEAARSSALVDSLQTVAVELSAKMKAALATADQSTHAWLNRVESLGPHNIYHMLSLNDQNSAGRVSNMAVFVDLFPDNEAYTGPFLRELYDELKSEEPTRALGYARMLRDYCQQRPALASVLVSAEIKQVLAQENHHE